MAEENIEVKQAETTSWADKAPEVKDVAPTVANNAPVESKEEVKKELLGNDVPAEIVPETYNFNVPDGFVLNESAIADFTPIAKELGLSNEKAQKLADVYAKIESDKMIMREQEEQKKQDAFIQAVKNDKEIGGANFDKSIALANSVISRFGSKDLAEVLTSNGVANHPELVKLFYNIGKVISEDSVIPNKGDTTTKQDVASLIFNKSLKGK